MFLTQYQLVNEVLDLSNKFLSEFDIHFDNDGLHHPKIEDLYISLFVVIIRDGRAYQLLVLITECCIFPENKIKYNLKKLRKEYENTIKKQIKDYYLGRTSLAKSKIKFSCYDIRRNIVYSSLVYN